MIDSVTCGATQKNTKRKKNLIYVDFIAPGNDKIP